MEKEDLERDLLVECEDDYVGLWRFPKGVREELGIADPQEAKRIVSEILARFILSGRIVAGDFEARGFVQWRLSAGEMLSRIMAEWDALGREPDICEIAWLTTPGGNLSS